MVELRECDWVKEMGLSPQLVIQARREFLSEGREKDWYRKRWVYLTDKGKRKLEKHFLGSGYPDEKNSGDEETAPQLERIEPTEGCVLRKFKRNRRLLEVEIEGRGIVMVQVRDSSLFRRGNRVMVRFDGFVWSYCGRMPVIEGRVPMMRDGRAYVEVGRR